METRIRTLIAAATLAVATAAAAQEPASLTGVVHDSFGAPLHGAVVRVAATDQSLVRVVTTDLQGQYRVDSLRAGHEYTVEISHREFRKKKLRAQAGPAPVNLQLKPKKSVPARAPVVPARERPSSRSLRLK